MSACDYNATSWAVTGEEGLARVRDLNRRFLRMEYETLEAMKDMTSYQTHVREYAFLNSIASVNIMKRLVHSSDDYIRMEALQVVLHLMRGSVEIAKYFVRDGLLRVIVPMTRDGAYPIRGIVVNIFEEVINTRLYSWILSGRVIGALMHLTNEDSHYELGFLISVIVCFRALMKTNNDDVLRALVDEGAVARLIYISKNIRESRDAALGALAYMEKWCTHGGEHLAWVRNAIEQKTDEFQWRTATQPEFVQLKADPLLPRMQKRLFSETLLT